MEDNYGLFDSVRELLVESVDEKYREFNSSLVPGESAIKMLGVRMPRIREIAKKIAKENGWEYLEAVKLAEQSKNVYHEELLLHGIIIGYLKCEKEERKKLLDEFVPVINNWAVCDCSCMTYKFMKKDAWEWYDYLTKYLTSDREYEIRFAVVCLLDHFVEEDFIDRILIDFDTVRHEGYYVKMAVAWAVSVCFVKFPEKTKKFLTEDHMDDFTHNKSIQKIRESFRVSREDKEWVKTLKREK
ncbi:MAG: DNA alkylation repair protein [Lachnospiraceae bacterium]